MKLNIDLSNLKKQSEENPIVALGVGAALLSGASKLINARSNARNSKAWKKEVDRRVKKSK